MLRKLLNIKYNKVYLYLFVICTIIEYTVEYFKFDSYRITIKITRMLLLFGYYISLVKKTNIYLTVFIITSFSASLIILKNKLTTTAIIFELFSRFLLLLYSFHIIKWQTLKINIIYAITIPFLISILFYTMYINNMTFYNQNIGFAISAISCEVILILIILASLINFLNNKRKGKKEFLIGTTITLLADFFYSMQDVSKSVDTNIVAISSFLYSLGLYLIIIAHKERTK